MPSRLQCDLAVLPPWAAGTVVIDYLMSVDQQTRTVVGERIKTIDALGVFVGPTAPPASARLRPGSGRRGAPDRPPRRPRSPAGAPPSDADAGPSLLAPPPAALLAIASPAGRPRAPVRPPGRRGAPRRADTPGR